MSDAVTAMIDTDVLSFLAGDETNERAATVRSRIEVMRSRKFQFWIPAPVLAEMGAGGVFLQALRLRLLRRLPAFRVADFGVAAADACGKMIAARMESAKKHGGGHQPTRHAMKFDAMIAAVAHVSNARYLLTGNGRDFSPFLQAVTSSTVVHQADQGDMSFAQQLDLEDKKSAPKDNVLQLPPAGSGDSKT